MDGTRPCPYCGEQIRVEAIRCRFCRSRLAAFDPESWHRDQPERRLAGVAAAVARGLAVSVGAVRVGFVMLTLFHLLGPALYGALWLLVPFRPGEDSLLARWLTMLRDVIDHLRRASGRSLASRSPVTGSPRSAATDVPEGPHA